jgi:hypothetical protein
MPAVPQISDNSNKEETKMPHPIAERTFLTCRSKECVRARSSDTRCVISAYLINNTGKIIANSLNRDKFCVTGSGDTVVTPHWTVSSSKPGRKKLLAEQKKEVADLDLLDLIGETGLEIT